MVRPDAGARSTNISGGAAGVAGSAPPVASPGRLWLVRGGFWYFLFPILTAGVLSAVPFFHAAYRLRDRKVLAWAGLYAVGGALAAFVVPTFRLTRDPGEDWATYVEALPASGVLTWQVVVALFLLTGLRRRVFHGVPVGALYDDAVLDDIAAVNPTERRFRQGLDWAREILAGAMVVLVCVGIPVGAVAQTLSNEGNLVVGDGPVQTVSLVAVALTLTTWLLAWLVLGYHRDDPVSTHTVFLAAAVVVNVYVGFGLWVTAARLIGIDPAVADPGAFGAMVWWNLVDSVPVLDVDSALGWKQPIEDYGPGVGWLFLTQRLILLLTLARAIQVLVNHWSTPPAAARQAAVADPAMNRPDWEPLAMLAALFRRSPRWMGGEGVRRGPSSG